MSLPGYQVYFMLIVFGYSLAGLALVLFLSRNISRTARMQLALLTLIILNVVEQNQVSPVSTSDLFGARKQYRK